VHSSSIVLRSLLLACAIGYTAAAQPADGSLLVSSGWLASHLRDPNLVLLHVGDRAEYDAKHIAGARYVGLDQISVSDRSGTGLTLELPPADKLQSALAGLGISNDSRIVVYYGNDRVSPTTRVIFTLDYAGLGDRVSLLDGGMPAWVRDGHEVTDVVPPARTGTLAVLKTKPLVASADFVRDRIGKSGVSIIDGRATSLYDGIQTGGGGARPHKTGHITGAKSVPFSEITDAQLRVKSKSDLAALFSKAGVQPSDTIVAYCHIGQQATAVIFAARLLGHPVVLYDGSFEDWSFRNYSVENPAAKP
jgi:thiosulfate/3-mercaptopyruvate sulfurtransferase